MLGAFPSILMDMLLPNWVRGETSEGNAGWEGRGAPPCPPKIDGGTLSPLPTGLDGSVGTILVESRH